MGMAANAGMPASFDRTPAACQDELMPMLTIPACRSAATITFCTVVLPAPAQPSTSRAVAMLASVGSARRVPRPNGYACSMSSRLVVPVANHGDQRYGFGLSADSTALTATGTRCRNAPMYTPVIDTISSLSHMVSWLSTTPPPHTIRVKMKNETTPTKSDHPMAGPV